jgi:hypothetical protein
VNPDVDAGCAAPMNPDVDAGCAMNPGADAGCAAPMNPGADAAPMNPMPIGGVGATMTGLDGGGLDVDMADMGTPVGRDGAAALVPAVLAGAPANGSKPPSDSSRRALDSDVTGRDAAATTTTEARQHKHMHTPSHRDVVHKQKLSTRGGRTWYTIRRGRRRRAGRARHPRHRLGGATSSASVRPAVPSRVGRHIQLEVTETARRADAEACSQRAHSAAAWCCLSRRSCLAGRYVAHSASLLRS